MNSREFRNEMLGNPEFIDVCELEVRRGRVKKLIFFWISLGGTRHRVETPFHPQSSPFPPIPMIDMFTQIAIWSHMGISPWLLLNFLVNFPFHAGCIDTLIHRTALHGGVPIQMVQWGEFSGLGRGY